jgi:alpha-1,2-mannosyltransferase
MEPRSQAQRVAGWLLALASLSSAVAYGLFVALRTYEVDLGVYLRLGGRYVFTSHLYSFGLPNTNLLFTYPPFAALLFAPWERVFGSVNSVQTAWTFCNLLALVGLLVLSVRVVMPAPEWRSALRLGMTLSLPALLLNPVLVTVGFGQVNLFVALLVMWDLLTERRIGRFQVPLGVATGLAAAVKLTPLLFVPFLFFTGRRRGAVQCMLTFVACELLTFFVSPASSTFYWTKGMFRPGRAGDLSLVRNQNLWAVVDRFDHAVLPGRVMLPFLALVTTLGLVLAVQAHRRSSPMLGLLVCAAVGLLVSPISWAHHMVWVVPALLWLALAEDRPRWGSVAAAGAAVVFWCAPIWWVPYKDTSDRHLRGAQLLAGNAFFYAVLAFVLGAAILVARRSPGIGLRRAGGPGFVRPARGIAASARRQRLGAPDRS